MKKRNLKSLVLKKSKISHLNILNSYGGNLFTDTIGSNTVPYLPTVLNCESEACDTYDPTGCQTTRTIADNTFEESCVCDALITGAAC